MRTLIALTICLATAVISHAQFTKLTDFNWTNGATPVASLIQAADGNFYGTTVNGGTMGWGTVFKVTAAGALTTLHSFNIVDGSHPMGSLLQAADGNLYGTTYGGGANNGNYGTVFKITPEGTLTTVYNFCPDYYQCPDGEYPAAGLVQGADGNFYGTTAGYDFNQICTGCGTVFRLTPAGAITTLHTFNGTDGANPYGALVQANDGNFYGTTYRGSNPSCGSGCGTVFRITPQGEFTTLYNFTGPDGAHPHATLVQGTDGNLYGTTYWGGSSDPNCGAGCGTVFKISLGGKLTLLHVFEPVGGVYPYGDLIQGTDGNFYGTTSQSWGANTAGTMFQMTPEGTLITLHSFTNPDGEFPQAGLVQANDGSFFGVTTSGGAYSYGTVFRFNLLALVPLSVAHSDSGTVRTVDGHIYCGNRCSYTYPGETSLTLSAVPAPGYFLTGWSGCDNVDGVYCTVTMSEPKNVTANFFAAYVEFSSLTFKPSYVKGGKLSAGTLSFSVPAGGVTIALSSDHPGVAHPPSFVIVPGGKSSVQFAVQTFPVKSNTKVTITATAGDSQISGTLTVGTTSLPPALK